MQAILKFDLPEEKQEFEYALKGAIAHVVLENLWNHLRSKLKYEELSEETENAYADIQDHLSKMLEECEVNLWG